MTLRLTEFICHNMQLCGFDSAPRTRKKHKMLRAIYLPAIERRVSLRAYVRRWVGWAEGGLSTSRADNGNAGRAARRGPPTSDAAGATAIIAPVLSPGA